MKVRKVKKLMPAGTLFTVKGTNYVGMSLGCDKQGKVSSFNMIDIGTGYTIDGISGKARKASKIEQRAYWNAMRRIIETKIKTEKETSLYREETDIFELFEQRATEWSKEEKKSFKKRINRIIVVLDWTEEKGRISYQEWEEYISMLESIKGWKLQGEQKQDSVQEEPPVVYVVTRCEEHSDYVEKVFFNENKAEEYCKQFNDYEDEYARDITKIQVTI